jgi:NADH-quinone oxidoreductase subunit M
LGGLAGNAPFLSLVFAFGAFASIGLPGLANFAGEVMVFFGAFDPSVGSITNGLKNIHWATICGLWGVVISAVYMLRAYRHLFFGKPTSGLFMSDLPSDQRFPYVFLAVVLLVAGCYPSFLSELVKGALVAVAK